MQKTKSCKVCGASFPSYKSRVFCKEHDTSTGFPHKISHKKWADKNPEKVKRIRCASNQRYGNKYRSAKREEVIRKLGGKCSNPACQWLNADGSRGCKDSRCLQFDHVNGGGSVERNKGMVGWRLLNDILADTNGKYQLLCANCNWIKKYERGENKRAI